MLSTNLNNAIRTAMVDEYEKQVARRRGMKKWSLPVKWRGEAVKLADVLRSRGIESADAARNYIAAQFDFLKKSFCIDVFKLTYPPIPIFNTYNSQRRYGKARLLNESYSKETTPESIKRTIVAELASVAGVELDRARLQFAMSAGTIGYATLAYLSLADKITSDLAGQVVSLHKAVDPLAEERFMDALRVVKQIGEDHAA